MAYNYTNYPSGFKSPMKEDGETVTVADEQVVALYQVLLTNKPITDKFDFITEVLNCAKRLIPDLEAFLRANQNNPKVPTGGFELLKETLEFMAGTPRGVPLDIYIELAHGEKGRHGSDFKFEVSNRSKLEVKVPSRLYLTEWSRRPGGVSDILCTLNYIFGTNPHE